MGPLVGDFVAVNVIVSEPVAVTSLESLAVASFVTDWVSVGEGDPEGVQLC